MRHAGGVMNIGNKDRQNLIQFQDGLLAGTSHEENSYEFMLTIADVTGFVCGRLAKWQLTKGLPPDVDLLVSDSKLDVAPKEPSTEEEIWHSMWKEPNASWEGALQHLLTEASQDSADWTVRLRCPIFERIFLDAELRTLPEYVIDIPKADFLSGAAHAKLRVIPFWYRLLKESWHDPVRRARMGKR